MEGFGFVGVGMFAVPFAVMLLVVAGGILSSPRGRHPVGVLLAAGAVIAALALPVVGWWYLIGF